MSDNYTEEQQEEVAAVPQPGVGERLREAREAREMGVAEVAAMLKLSPRQIEALEAGDWKALPGSAFIRGFIRNYARVVRIDPDPLLADLDVPTSQPPRLEPPGNVAAVMPTAADARRKDYAAVLGGVVLVAVAVVAYFVVPPDFWRSSSDADNKPPAETAAVAEPAFPPGAAPAATEGGAPASESTGAAAGQPAPETPASAGAAKAPAKEAAADKPAAGRTEPEARAAAGKEVAASGVAAPPNAASGTITAAEPARPASANALKLRFTQPSWVEIRDRNGQILHAGLNAADSERAVEGGAPFSLVVGNATHVSLSWKGKEIPLQPRSKDDVARLTVE